MYSSFLQCNVFIYSSFLQCKVFIYSELFCNAMYSFFSRPTNFLQKSSCRVSSEKNILNSSVDLRGVSGVEWKNWIKVISLFTFPHIFCFGLLSILSIEARMIVEKNVFSYNPIISEAYDIFVYHHRVALCLALCLIFR